MTDFLQKSLNLSAGGAGPQNYARQWGCQLMELKVSILTSNRLRKTTGSYFYSQKCTSTYSGSYMHTNTAGVIWGMLNIYLSSLPGWLHQSSLPDCPLLLKIPYSLSGTVTLKANTAVSNASVPPLLCYSSCCFFETVNRSKHLNMLRSHSLLDVNNETTRERPLQKADQLKNIH